jgi:hypothetical protein
MGRVFRVVARYAGTASLPRGQEKLVSARLAETMIEKSLSGFLAVPLRAAYRAERIPNESWQCRVEGWRGVPVGRRLSVSGVSPFVPV